MNATMLLSISNSTIVWSVIAIVILGAFACKVVESISTVKKLEKAYKAKSSMKVMRANIGDQSFNKAA